MFRAPGQSLSFLLIVYFLSACADNNSENDLRSWKVYRGDDGINAYSSLDQINRENVKLLKVAWTYRSGDTLGNSTIECNPIIVNGILYGVSPRQKTFALDAKTGKELWVFNPHDEKGQGGGVSRGLSYWEEGDDQRIYMFANHRLLALDARTGKQIMSFGENGVVDLRKGLRDDKEIEKYYKEKINIKL